MSVVRTGHAEIDQQHQILESLVGRLQAFCPRKTPAAQDVACEQCDSKVQANCARTLKGVAREARAFLIGHSTYEERMMDLLPDNAACQAHIRAHKAAHVGIDKGLQKLLGQGADGNPLDTSPCLILLAASYPAFNAFGRSVYRSKCFAIFSASTSFTPAPVTA